MTLHELSVVGGVTYPYRSVPLSRQVFSWPFARLTLGPTAIIVGPRGWLQGAVKPTVIPYEAVTRVERSMPPAFLRYAETLRFRSDREEWDRLSFSAFPGRVDKVVTGLLQRGIRVR